MKHASLVAALGLVAWFGGVASANEDDGPDGQPPRDAPAACIDPVGKDGLPAMLSRGKVRLGVYTLTVGKPLETPRFRILAQARFIPERVGSKLGEWLPGLEVTLLPDATRDGISYRNSVEQSGYDPVLIDRYRVAVTSVKNGGKKLEVVIDDLGCFENAVHAPLAVGESKVVWLSTEATHGYAFSTGHWYEDDPRMSFELSADLDPEVQQDPGTTKPHGWIALKAWERMEGSPSWDDRYIRDVKVGTKLVVPSHTVEILKIVLGDGTTVEDGTVYTRGKRPVVHVLAQITRR